MRKSFFAIALFFLSLVVASRFITIFTIKPIGAVPEGATLIIYSTSRTRFVDSADAMCLREQGDIKPLCRMAALTYVTQESENLLKLPYWGFLHDITVKYYGN